MSELPERPLRITADDIDRVPDALVSRSETPNVGVADSSGDRTSRRWIIGGTVATCIVAVIIAAVALLLPGWRNHDAASIERVLAADATTHSGANSVAEVVARMRSIDFEGCPTNFQAAYVAHIHAWETMAAVEQEAKSFQDDYNSGGAMVESFIRGFLGDPFGKVQEGMAAQNQLQRDYQQAAQQIRDTYYRVEEIAVARGARLPKR
ncbi:MAG: hypothetical protein U0573_12275 [Phycisphaerales bacterium]